MAQLTPRTTAPLPQAEAVALDRVLQADRDVTIFVDGTVHRLTPAAVDAVVDLLQRLARGEAVTVSSVAELLTTSQAADFAGISHTFLRNMTDRGEIPVQYRGSHRRIRRDDMEAWLRTQKSAAGTVDVSGNGHGPKNSA
ncbi:helix-turn-helix domain-containing protein [Paenarthrobacter sp. Z7-10]|uniref:helix-turn-helix domain-containing protein n=1 Tax=Paenarthrobacter sp. Z7-10 TaxID=2787635 RepID=UPI0022A9B936|nr:helix-turn-helix domain-containing protein [Paenarthrobacter sp. Z7-10]MCZ2401657.1 helix-turn-helix domain-containing protein [Paenarthrobacter sp. Z7-10]